MNLMQILQMLQGSTNPMSLLQQLTGNNPIVQRALQMAQGKEANQLQEIAKNLARQRGMNEQQLNQFLSQFGIKV